MEKKVMWYEMIGDFIVMLKIFEVSNGAIVLFLRLYSEYMEKNKDVDYNPEPLIFDSWSQMARKYGTNRKSLSKMLDELKGNHIVDISRTKVGYKISVRPRGKTLWEYCDCHLHGGFEK